MRAIKIDPYQRTVSTVDVALNDVSDLLATTTVDTIDFRDGHCMVIDDSEQAGDQPTRFRFSSGALRRPYFGRALVFGSQNGNWSPATMEASVVLEDIVWEQWRAEKEEYDMAMAR